MLIARLSALAIAGSALAQPLHEPPITPVGPVTDTYHGVEIVDEYRWLEDWSDPAVRAWSEEQNAYARDILDGLPHVDALRERLTTLLSAPTTQYLHLAWADRQVFALKRQPPMQQPFIVVMANPYKPQEERVLLDPNKLDPDGGTSIDWFVPSHDGSMIAVSLSRHGSEAGDVHVFSVETGEQIHEVVPRVNGGTAGGSLAWAPDDHGFYYTRYPREGERPAEDMAFYTQVYFHALGTPTEDDRYEQGEDWPRIAEIQLAAHEDGKLLATVQFGDSGRFALHVRTTDADWRQISDFDDPLVQAAFGPDDSLFVVSRAGASRGKVQRIDLASPSLDEAVTIIPESEHTIVSDFWEPSVFTTTEERLVLTYQMGGPSELRSFEFDGAPSGAPSVSGVIASSGVTPLDGDDLLFLVNSYTRPPTWHHFNARHGASRPTALSTPSPVDYRGYRVAREFATSKDGTQIPINIIAPRQFDFDGSTPCLATGYGGYGVSITPSYSVADYLLLEQGFVLAEANLRGGGEFGDDWHRQGNLANKQNVFDDFAAVCRHLVERGYTSPDKLAIQGGSNGGLLMGATLTQHPDLAAAVVSHVGIYDMLRVELSPNGAFNIPEFGTVKDPDLFKALRAYSPYHNVIIGVDYPPTLFLTGANDPRVDPMQSRKMTAALQAASPGSLTLLRTSSTSGHGGGTALSERIEQTVDVFAFLFAQLGVDYQPPRERPPANPPTIVPNPGGG